MITITQLIVQLENTEKNMRGKQTETMKKLKEGGDGNAMLNGMIALYTEEQTTRIQNNLAIARIIQRELKKLTDKISVLENK